jgi:hypothetical protein
MLSSSTLIVGVASDLSILAQLDKFNVEHLVAEDGTQYFAHSVDLLNGRAAAAVWHGRLLWLQKHVVASYHKTCSATRHGRREGRENMQKRDPVINDSCSTTFSCWLRTKILYMWPRCRFRLGFVTSFASFSN